MNYHNIPAELRALPQWVVAGSNKIPLNPRDASPADPTDPETWGTYEEALRAGYKHVGFVLSHGDPYAIIDLDDPFTRKDKTPILETDIEFTQAQAMAERHQKIYEASDGYAEVSQSGKGVHIVVKGVIPHGVRRDKVEVYAEARYMIFTGNVLRSSPIVDEQELLDALYKEMSTTYQMDLVEVDPTMEDGDIMQRALAADNGDKFDALFNGRWEDLGYPSQSEADFALMAIIAFYTPSNEQCREIFRRSELGQRKKARTDQYLDYMLRKIRAQQIPTVDISELITNAHAHLKDQSPPPPQRKGPPPPPSNASTDGATQRDHQPPHAPPPPRPTHGEGKAGKVIFPQGFIGDLARYFVASAIRPVDEIALASAIALLAGVVARSYNISGTGLNQYLILIAKTGSGKEGIANSIDRLVAEVRKTVPSADRFMGPAAFASGQALVKVLNDRPCFVSILGEFGITLQQMCDVRAPAATTMLKKIVLDLYGKSGFNQVLRPSVYSDAEKNTKMVQAPNVTILGESTPEEFYGKLDAGQVMSGLIPRFTTIEYNGPRPARNKNAFGLPPDELVSRFSDFLTIALTTEQNHTCAPIQIDPAALTLLDAFDEEATNFINGRASEVEKHIWNRAHLKALKLAGLVAVGVDPANPVVSETIAAWAIRFVRADVGAMASRFASGDVGEGQAKQEHDLRRAIDDYLRMTAKERALYKVAVKLVAEPLVPYGYLRRRLRMCASFKNDRNGFSKALDQTLDAMVKAGDLALVAPLQARDLYDLRSPLYGLGSSY